MAVTLTITGGTMKIEGVYDNPVFVTGSNSNLFLMRERGFRQAYGPPRQAERLMFGWKYKKFNN